MNCEKRYCYVVCAFYREDLVVCGETPMCEEELYLSYPQAERARMRFLSDADFESVYMTEEYREVYI